MSDESLALVGDEAAREDACEDQYDPGGEGEEPNAKSGEGILTHSRHTPKVCQTPLRSLTTIRNYEPPPAHLICYVHTDRLLRSTPARYKYCGQRPSCSTLYATCWHIRIWACHLFAHNITAQ